MSCFDLIQRLYYIDVLTLMLNAINWRLKFTFWYLSSIEKSVRVQADALVPPVEIVVFGAFSRDLPSLLLKLTITIEFPASLR